MCGACAAGPATPPPEARSEGGRTHLRRRAAEAQALSDGRLRVTPFGAFGYVVTTRTGASRVTPDLAGLVDALLVLGGPVREVAAAAWATGSADGAGRGAVAAAVLDRPAPA